MGQSNKLFYTILLLVALSIISVFVYSATPSTPNPGHSAGAILVTINGQDMTLQEAINSGTLGQDGSGQPSTPPGGSASPQQIFFCTSVPSTQFCNLSTPFVYTGKNQDGTYSCCNTVDANQIEVNEVTIAVDNNGAGDEDCWTEYGGLLVPPCGSKKWDGTPLSATWCVSQLLSYYNTLLPAQLGFPKKGGWIVQSWTDTGAPGTCLDTSSDLIKVKLARYIGS
jgi:hypothetical protein